MSNGISNLLNLPRELVSYIIELSVKSRNTKLSVSACCSYFNNIVEQIMVARWMRMCKKSNIWVRYGNTDIFTHCDESYITVKHLLQKIQLIEQ